MRQRPAGLTLVELLVSVALGSVLCLGLTTLLAFSQRAYLQDEELARLQENGRHALKLLRRELSMAGYLGRLHPRDVSSLAPSGTACYSYLLAPEPGLEHFDDIGENGLSASGASVPAACRRTGQYQSGSDALVLRRTLDRPHRDFSSFKLPIAGTTLYLEVAGRSGTLLAGTQVAADATGVWQYQPLHLFVRNYSRSPGDNIPALCRQRLSPNRFDVAPLECLVEGVEMLQLEYGLDTDGDRLADRYQAVPGSADPGRVVLVRVYLLMRGAREVTGYRDDRSYQLGGTLFQAGGDRYYRQLFSTVVLVRNSDVFRS